MLYTDFKQNAIAIDTEYHTDRAGRIDKVFCIAAQTIDGRVFQQWTADGGASTLRTIADRFGIAQPVFVCHAYTLAERRAFKALGDDPDAFQWLDTCICARVLMNAAFYTDKTASYADACRYFLNVDIDTAHKDMMRELCIRDATNGNEQEIMDYCLSDVAHLHELVNAMLNAMQAVYADAIPMRAERWRGPLDTFLHWGDVVKAFGRVADYGIPVNVGRLDALIHAADARVNAMFKDMAIKYPDCFRFDLKGWHEVKTGIQARITAESMRLGIADYPRTASGKAATDSKTLNEHFSGTEGFGNDYRHMQNLLPALRGLTTGKWIRTLDRNRGRLMYGDMNAFGSQTGRCQPRPSDGFVFLWSKDFYGILEPPDGYWMVECDYHSQETGIQAVSAQDANYTDFYKAKDCYWYMAAQLGLVAQNDYDRMSKDELKGKYGNDLRQTVKKFTLARQYGAGATKLAAITAQDVDTIRAWNYRLDHEVFGRLAAWKETLARVLKSPRKRTQQDPCGMVLRDGFYLRTRPQTANERTQSKSMLSILNFPIQGQGGLILRELVLRLVAVPHVIPIATVHDAVVFMVPEGDTETIEHVRTLMADVAADVLSDPSHTVTVGEADIIRHGEVWCPDDEHLKAWHQLMQSVEVS